MFQKFFMNSPIPYSIHRVYLDKNGHPVDYEFLAVNQAYKDLLKLQDLEIEHKRFYDLFPSGWEGEEQWKETFHEAILKKIPTAFIMHHQKIEKWIRVVVFPMFGDIFACIHYDVTKEYMQDQAMEAFLKVNIDMFSVSSIDGYFLKVNKAFEQILGYTEEELKGKSFFHFIHEDDIPMSKKIMESLKNQEFVSSYVNRVRNKDGTYRYIEWHSQPIGNYIYSSARDITEKRKFHMHLSENNQELLKLTDELKSKNNILQMMADRDELTGIYNRHYLNQWLEVELERSDEQEQYLLTMILLDLDHFKRVNDQWGHLAGDEVLKQTTKLISQLIKEPNLFVRQGGEEFCIILKNCDLDKGVQIAEKVRKKLNDYQFPDIGNQTASFGVAERKNKEPFNLWYKRADEALYRAKKMGRNCVIKWEESFDNDCEQER